MNKHWSRVISGVSGIKNWAAKRIAGVALSSIGALVLTMHESGEAMPTWMPEVAGIVLAVGICLMAVEPKMQNGADSDPK